MICGTPLLSEAVEAALGDVMTVQSFPSGTGDTVGLLGALRPDGIVVDGDEDAASAAAFAAESGLPLVHVSLAERTLRVLRAGRWEPADATASAEAVRNIMVGGIFGKDAA